MNPDIFNIDSITMKRCSSCKEVKALTPDNYHKDKQKSYGYCPICKECSKLKHKRHENSPNYKQLRAATYQRNIEWHKQYRKKIQYKRNILEKERKKSDQQFALKNRVRVLMYHTIRHIKNGRRWQDLVGYSVDDLRNHIEKSFTKGMTWKLLMDGKIHIDHIIPVTAFNYSCPEDEDFKRCWALSNLRPMWAVDNIKKGNKLIKPFQPSFALGGVG